MAYIRVPTGVKNVTVTASKRTFFYFRCASCGKEALVPFKVTGTAQGSYHVLNSSEKKEAVANEARQNSQAALSGADAELFNGVNVKKDYSVVKKAIKCPYCNKKQPWSLLRDLIHTPFIVPFVGMLLFSIIMLFRNIGVANMAGMFISLLTLVASAAFFPLLCLYRNRKKEEKWQNDPSFVPPVYYNEVNLKELINSPAVVLLEELMQQQQ